MQSWSSSYTIHAKFIIIAMMFLKITNTSIGQDIEQTIKSQPVSLSGSLAANLNTYNVQRGTSINPSFRYGIRANLDLKLFGFSLPFYLNYADNNFDFGKPHSRFRINPTYKWIQLYFGNIYMNYSPYTLSRRTVKGYGVSLTPGIFTVKTVYGKVEDIRAYRDTIQSGVTPIPTYSRRLAGLSLGIAKKKFKTEVMIVKTWDQEDSTYSNRNFTPKSNLVIGNKTHVSLGKKVKIESNIGYSLMTQNIDSYGENYIIGTNALTENLAELNLTSYATYAGDIRLAYQHNRFDVNIKTQYIQPYFQPLSVAYTNNDLINNTIGLNMVLFKKITLSTNLGIQSNNLSRKQLSTSNSFIRNIVANIPITKTINFSFIHSNYSQDYTASQINIGDLYTYAVTNKNSTATLNIRGLSKASRKITLGISSGIASYNLISETDQTYNEYQSLFGNINTGIHFTTINLKWNVGLNYRQLERDDQSQNYYSVTNTVTKQLIDKRLNLNLRTNYSLSSENDNSSNNTFSNTLSCSYKVSDQGQLGLNFSIVSRKTRSINTHDESRATLNYRHSFRPSKKVE